MRTIATAFDLAAPTYAAAADLQHDVAQQLAARIRALPLPPRLRVLEIGCGTGLLTQMLAPALAGDWTVTDLSPAMVREAQARLAPLLPEAQFKVMDGQAPVASGTFDLICSNLAFQWFEQLPEALARLSRLLSPKGVLAFTTLGPETFKEWRAVCRAQGVAAIPRAFSGPAALMASAPPGFALTLEQAVIPRGYASGWEFLLRLRAIGAHRALPAARPLGSGALRRVLRATEGGFTASYHVITGILQRR